MANQALPLSNFIRTQCNICKTHFCAVNCLDQHVQKCPESVALIWERDEPGTEVRITYRYCVSPDSISVLSRVS